MMNMQEVPFEEFEKAVMQKIMEEETEINKILREQYKKALVTDRYFSGAGFFTDFKIADDVPRIMQEVDYAYGDIGAIINDVHAYGFILFIKDGAFFMLEGYTWGLTWPEKINNYTLVKEIIRKS